MYSDSGRDIVPSSTTSPPLLRFCSARSVVGSSSLRPLMNTTSALLSTSAADGGGSKVWLFTPSGTMPVTVALSPAMFATIDVIGATVVTTLRALSVEADGLLAPQAVRSSPPARASGRTRVRVTKRR